MRENKKQIISLLRREREARGWSRDYVAEQVEVDVATVGRWERGERLPHPRHQQKLCELFGKDSQELGFLPKAPEALDDLTVPPDLSLQDLPTSTSTSIDKVYRPAPLPLLLPLLPQRRMLLAGLGGLSLLALTSGLWIANRPSSPEPTRQRKSFY